MTNSPRKGLVAMVDDLMIFRSLTGDETKFNEIFPIINELYLKEDHMELIRQILRFFRINCRLKVGLSPSKKSTDYNHQEELMKSIGKPFKPELFFLSAGISYEEINQPATIYFPSSMPALSSSGFKNTEVKMIISRWALMLPPEMVVFIVIHQLSHIMLSATKSRHQKNKFAPDVLAMILIGPELMEKVRTTKSLRLGHLNDKQFEIVLDTIKSREKGFSLSKIRTVFRSVLEI